MASNNRPVQTTATSLGVLEAIKELDGAGVGALKDETGLARSTLHNHLQTLLNTGYVIKEGNQYQVSMKLLNLGEYARHRKPEFDLARRTVRELANVTNAEAEFTVRENNKVVIVHKSMGSSDESVPNLGRHFHFHSTAAGKAILAELPRADEMPSSTSTNCVKSLKRQLPTGVPSSRRSLTFRNKDTR
ncbi:helix-turn-helix domain-containing protein [Haloarculaceae archaeon H-GB2-1]|nr:helix-turn-helix domain-containing protein [Haloarculaceae archaeon H-GB11]MEA5409647.1 helix-turn-helix domain-containing protein [Haloarculaceae archaeon H-GB2-1]